MILGSHKMSHFLVDERDRELRQSIVFLMEKSGRRPCLKFRGKVFCGRFEIKNAPTQRCQGTGRVPKFGSFLIFDVFIR